MRHDGTANLVIGRRRCGEKKALHRGNIGLIETVSAAGKGWTAARFSSGKMLIFLG